MRIANNSNNSIKNKGGSALCSEIYKLVLAIWEKEIVPEQWKESIIVPIFKKGDKTNCGNFRGISLLLTSYKILSNILLRRLTPYVDEIIGDHQCGFRRNRSTIDQIFCIRQIMEKKWEYKGTVHQSFIDFKKAYDSVKREVLYDILIEFGIPKKLVRLIKMCLSETYSRVRIVRKNSSQYMFRNSSHSCQPALPYVSEFKTLHTFKFKVCRGSLYAVMWLADEPREFNLPTLPQTYIPEKLPSKYGFHSEECLPIRTTITYVFVEINFDGQHGHGAFDLCCGMLPYATDDKKYPAYDFPLKTQFDRGYGSTQTVQTAICCYDVQVIPYTFSSSD
ncbi:hypothetical protein ANN_25283 [Periplaneta americana]|uniref:Reverse transcriptase domain-containing protein n=1 Tax=Periplaneta americana TaxID=6978 RepID=A0ABQ8S1J3_PERAM|nr:hypothetical protein ANN_25283 [Periplaneta americana]